MSTKTGTKQAGIIAALQEIGYQRVPRSRSPAIMARGAIEQKVHLDGTIETWVNGRLIVDVDGKRSTGRTLK